MGEEINYLGEEGLDTLIDETKKELDKKQPKEEGKGLSSNDLTDDLKISITQTRRSSLTKSTDYSYDSNRFNGLVIEQLYETVEGDGSRYQNYFSLQKPVDISKEMILNATAVLKDKISNSYVKPSEGIPKTDLSSELQNKINAAIPNTTTHLSGDIAITEKGAANGVATLDQNGVIPSAQLPSYIDDVVEYDSVSDFPATGESGKIYVDTTENKTYRWSGTTYVAIGSSLALGETSSTAYAGDKGKATTDIVNSHVNNGAIHVSDTDRRKIDTAANSIPMPDSYDYDTGKFVYTGAEKGMFTQAYNPSTGEYVSAPGYYSDRELLNEARLSSEMAAKSLKTEIEKRAKTRTVDLETFLAMSDEERDNGTQYFVKTIDGAILPVRFVTKAQYDALGDKTINDNVIYILTDVDYQMTSKQIKHGDSTVESELKGLATSVSKNTGAISTLNSTMNELSNTVHTTVKPFSSGLNGGYVALDKICTISARGALAPMGAGAVISNDLPTPLVDAVIIPVYNASTDSVYYVRIRNVGTYGRMETFSEFPSGNYVFSGSYIIA